MKQLLYILPILFSLSCSEREVRTIQICFFKVEALESCGSISLAVNPESDRILYEYFDSTDNKEWKPNIERILATDSGLTHDYLECALRDYRDFKVNDVTFRVYRYMYDDTLLSDDNTEIYFTDSIGMLIGVSTPWNRHATYVSDNVSKELVRLIKSDSSGFWYYNQYPWIKKDTAQGNLMDTEELTTSPDSGYQTFDTAYPTLLISGNEILLGDLLLDDKTTIEDYYQVIGQPNRVVTKGEENAYYYDSLGLRIGMGEWGNHLAVVVKVQSRQSRISEPPPSSKFQGKLTFENIEINSNSTITAIMNQVEGVHFSSGSRGKKSGHYSMSNFHEKYFLDFSVLKDTITEIGINFGSRPEPMDTDQLKN